jgi:hypothetical protein
MSVHFLESVIELHNLKLVEMAKRMKHDGDNDKSGNAKGLGEIPHQLGVIKCHEHYCGGGDIKLWNM